MGGGGFQFLIFFQIHVYVFQHAMYTTTAEASILDYCQCRVHEMCRWTSTWTVGLSLSKQPCVCFGTPYLHINHVKGSDNNIGTSDSKGHAVGCFFSDAIRCTIELHVHCMEIPSFIYGRGLLTLGWSFDLKLVNFCL